MERKTTARRLAQELVRRNLSAVAMHADLDQAEREENLRLFKARQVRILVATDIVSRGIDVEDIALVVNFNVPQTVEAYVHRVGRTARAENNGWALTLVGSEERRAMEDVEKFLGVDVKVLPDAGLLMPSEEGAVLEQPSARRSTRRTTRSGRRRDQGGSPSGKGQRRGAHSPRGEAMTKGQTTGKRVGRNRSEGRPNDPGKKE